MTEYAQNLTRVTSFAFHIFIAKYAYIVLFVLSFVTVFLKQDIAMCTLHAEKFHIQKKGIL